MAVLQIIGKTATTHNYTEKSVIGHEGRTSDDDYGTWYTKSVFSEVAGE